MTIIQSLEQIKTGADVSSDNIADLFFLKKDKFRNVINYEQPNAKKYKEPRYQLHTIQCIYSYMFP